MTSERTVAGLRRRAHRIVAAAGLTPAAHADLPLSIRIASDHLPDPAAPPAYVQRKAGPLAWDCGDFSDDEPETLRASGPVAVGSALWRLVDWSACAPEREVREVAAIIREWLTDEHIHDSLDMALGLRRRDGRPNLKRRSIWAERDRLIVRLAAHPTLSRESRWATAVAIRAAFASYRANGWLRDRDRRTRPATEPHATFWAILKLGLTAGLEMPKPAKIAAVLLSHRADRQR